MTPICWFTSKALCTLGAGNSTWMQEPSYWSCHLLFPKICISRKVESGAAEPGFSMDAGGPGCPMSALSLRKWQGR